MTSSEGGAQSPGKKERGPRANRQTNGMGTRAGVPDPPTRGRFTRSLALLDAALRVWETNHCPRRASVWRHTRSS
jgi:hypothetical protein